LSNQFEVLYMTAIVCSYIIKNKQTNCPTDQSGLLQIVTKYRGTIQMPLIGYEKITCKKVFII